MADDSTLWVGGLADQVTEDHLHELFLQAGPLEKVTRPKDKDGTPKKFAFVEFRHAESVPYAIQVMDGIKLFNHHLRLKGRTGSQHDNSHSGSPLAQPNFHHADSPSSRSSRGGPDYHRSRSFHDVEDRKRGHAPVSGLITYPGHGHHHRGVNRSSSGGDDRRGPGGRPFNGPAPDPLSQPFSNSASYAPSNMQPQSFEDRRNRLLQKQSMSSSFQVQAQQQQQQQQQLQQQQQQQMGQMMNPNQYGGYNFNYAQSFTGFGGQQQWNQNW